MNDDDFKFPDPGAIVFPASTYDDLIQSCEEKAKAAGKLEEYRSAAVTYGRFISNRGLLSIVALARTGVDVAALETLFLMREQEAKERQDRAIQEISKNFTANQLQAALGSPYWARPVFGSNIRDAYRPFTTSIDSIVQEAKEWAAKGYPSPVPDAIEAMRTAGASTRDFADNIILQDMKKKTP